MSRTVVRRVGAVAQPDLEKTLNCGLGMVALTDPTDADAAIAALAAHGIRAWVAGEVAASTAGAPGRVRLTGAHPGWQ